MKKKTKYDQIRIDLKPLLISMQKMANICWNIGQKQGFTARDCEIAKQCQEENDLLRREFRKKYDL